MKTIDANMLPDLPRAVKSLVRDGVYSLYEVAREGAQYLLVTNKSEFYLLSKTGAVVPSAGVRSLDEIEPLEVVSLSNLPHEGSVQLNWV